MFRRNISTIVNFYVNNLSEIIVINKNIYGCAIFTFERLVPQVTVESKLFPYLPTSRFKALSSRIRINSVLSTEPGTRPTESA